MSTITMTVKAIKPPADGKKRGILVGSDDTIIGVFAEKIGLFRNGYTYEIDCSETESNGNTYRNVKNAKEIEGPKPTAQAAPASNGNGYHRSADEQIFVCALMKEFIRAGLLKIDKTQLWECSGMLQAVHRHRFGEGGAFLASEAGKAARG